MLQWKKLLADRLVGGSRLPVVMENVDLDHLALLAFPLNLGEDLADEGRDSPDGNRH